MALGLDASGSDSAPRLGTVVLIGPPESEQRVLDAKSMPHFYLALVVHTYRSHGHRVSGVLTVLALVALFVAVVDRGMARDMTNWVGFSPLWGVVPILLVVVWALLDTIWRLHRNGRDDLGRLRIEVNAMREDARRERPTPESLATLGGVLDLALHGAQTLEREREVRGDDWFVEAVTEWAGETDLNLERVKAGDLRTRFADDGVAPDTLAGYRRYLSRRVAILEKAQRKVTGRDYQRASW